MCVKMEFLQVDFNGIEEKNEYINIIRQVIKKCYNVENLEDSKLYINVILTNPANIKKINRDYRNIDKETDVLSFPMFEKKDLELKLKNKGFEHIVNMSVYNAYCNFNPFLVYVKGSNLYKLSLFPILPSVSYTFKF